MGGTAGCGVQAAMAIDIREDRVKMGIVSREGNVLFSRRYPWETSSVAGFLDALVLDIADFQRQAACGSTLRRCTALLTPFRCGT